MAGVVVNSVGKIVAGIVPNSGAPNFLALKYVASNLGTSYRSFRKSLSVLDQVAEIKRSDALLCEVFNQRISDRFLARMG